jgi:perosamine synthetase
MNIPLCRPNIGDSEIESVVRVLRSNQLSLGPALKAFEDQFAAYIGSKYAIAASSGTSALHMCVRAMGLEAGTEVLTTSFSFVASTNCLLYERVHPRFIDIDSRTFNLDAELLEEFLRYSCVRRGNGEVVDKETGLVVKAVLPVHVFGLPADMSRISVLAQEFGLRILEDACEAIGAKQDGRLAGTFGDAAVFAFYPNKQITTGEGGMVVTNDASIAEVCRSLRNQGRDADGRWLNHVNLGFNYRLSDIQCALGSAQLARIDELLASRARVAEKYIELLEGIDSVRLPHADSRSQRSWFVFCIQLMTGQNPELRDAVRDRLAKAGIASQAYFPAIHRQPYFVEVCPELPNLPQTELASDTCLALPFYPSLSDGEVGRVVEFLTEAIQEQVSPDRLSSVKAN